MRCVVCGWGVPSVKMEEYKQCTSCGNTLQYDVTDVFEYGAGGLVKERRKGQIDMVNLIDDNLVSNDQTVMLLEGGTGVGKSYAYLVPSLLKHREKLLRRKVDKNNKEHLDPKEHLKSILHNKIYVSTSTIQLQEQIYTKDLEQEILTKLNLRPEIRTIVLKGGANYACLHPAVAKNIENKTEREEFENFIFPYRKDKCFIDDKPVSTPIRPDWWQHINLENCIEEEDKRRCPYHAYCRPNLSNYNVIVVNHTLMAILMAHNLLNGKTNHGLLNTLIVDEAHSFISNLYKACTEEIKENFLVYLSKKVVRDPYITDMNINKQFDVLKDIFKQLFKACLDWSKKAKADGGIMLPKEKFKYEEQYIVQQLYPAFRSLLIDIKIKLEKIADKINPRKDEPVLDTKGIQVDDKVNLELLAAYARITKYSKKLNDAKESLDAAMQTFGTGIMSSKLPVINEESISLVPTDIGEYAQRFLDGVPKALFLSATLSLGEDFTFIKKQLGLDRPPIFPERPTTIVEGVFKSPFNYAGNGFSYTPIHVAQCPTFKSSPEDRERWYDSMAENIVELTEKNQGDAFVLFTARTEMEAIYARCLRYKPANSVISHIMQVAKGPEAEKRYRNTDNAVLFGLKSFWEGIDIPGDKLRMVIIVKLPFPIQSDPVIAIETRKAKVLNLQDFKEVQIPRMLMSLRQAAGRLIRTQDDKGVVVVLDSRIWTGGNHNRLKTLQKDAELKKPINAESYGKEAMKVLNFKYRVDNKEMFVKLFHRLYAKDPRFVITG
jgi:ATP-dependent DNA helicase DinG